MSTIQFANLTDKELVREAEWQMGKNEHGMSVALQLDLLKRFEQYAYDERVASPL